MEDEKRERLLPAGSGDAERYRAPPTAPQMPSNESGGSSAQPPAYPHTSGSDHNQYVPQPTVPVQQVVIVQAAQQVSVDSIVKSDFCPCCPDTRNRWSRRNGFILATAWVILSAITVILLAMGEYSDYSQTKDFHEGKCETFKTFQSQNVLTCDAPNCNTNCDRAFPCNVVMGTINYGTFNRSKLIQIYATYEDFDRNLGECSYKPPTHCKSNTEKYFLSNGAFDEQQYTCYYSSSEPIKVVLKKTSFKLNINLVFPTLFIFLGIGLLFAIKCCGHKFGCPSQSQIRRQRQQQQQDQQQMQMRPL